MYRVIPYEEAPCEPMEAKEFGSLWEAIRYAFRSVGGRPDRTMAGETYEDGTEHVQAYYQDTNRSSGLWIVRTT